MDSFTDVNRYLREQSRVVGRLRKATKAITGQEQGSFRTLLKQYIVTHALREDSPLVSEISKLAKSASRYGVQAANNAYNSVPKGDWPSTGIGANVINAYNITYDYSVSGVHREFNSPRYLNLNFSFGNRDELDSFQVSGGGKSYPLWMILEYGLFSKFVDPAIQDTFATVKGYRGSYQARTRHYKLFSVMYGGKGDFARKVALKQRTDDSVVASLLRKRKRIPEYVPIQVQVNYKRTLIKTRKEGRWFTTTKVKRIGLSDNPNIPRGAIERGFRMVRLDRLYDSNTQADKIELRRRSYGVAGRHFIFSSRQATMTKVQNELNTIINKATNYYTNGNGAQELKKLLKIFTEDTSDNKTVFRRTVRRMIAENKRLSV